MSWTTAPPECSTGNTTNRKALLLTRNGTQGPEPQPSLTEEGRPGSHTLGRGHTDLILALKHHGPPIQLLSLRFPPEKGVHIEACPFQDSSEAPVRSECEACEAEGICGEKQPRSLRGQQRGVRDLRLTRGLQAVMASAWPSLSVLGPQVCDHRGAGGSRCAHTHGRTQLPPPPGLSETVTGDTSVDSPLSISCYNRLSCRIST